MRIVVDTGVLVRGLLSPYGAPAAVLRALLGGRATLCYDERILAEYRDVLTGGSLAFDADDVGELLGFLEAAGQRILAGPARRGLPEPAAAMFVEVAAAAGADCLVTGHAEHFPEAARDGCAVTTPGELAAALL